MNFDYILQLAESVPGFKRLHDYCSRAEIFQKSFPAESANNARKALEWLVKNMLKMKGVEVGERENLNEMLHAYETYAFINHDWRFQDAIRKVHRIGNLASHDGADPINANQAFCCLRALYDVVAGFMFRWEAIRSIEPFNALLVPQSLTQPVVKQTPEPQVAQDVVESVPQEAIEHPQTPVLPRESLASEAVTRKYFIDYMLNEAGWEVLTVEGDIQGGKACIEIELDGMPNQSGKGYADYVLFSRGGKPLAVIEAKATTHEVGDGRRQAIMYADLLERKYGVRPVIYYTNGFRTKVIDGLGNPDRDVCSFHSMDDLERMIQKRGRANIRDLRISEEITNRPYQQTAIKSLVEWLNNHKRRGLLVLATGTGKTRVSISLCDILMRNDWVKNVLFLADRTALVNQAHKNYEALLPSVSMTVLSEEREPDMQARIMFSTYQTMINYIDREKKPFSIGRFDLIIIDEAHRSVYGKYESIFKYFDSLLIGLTATPRNEVERNTYELLEMDNCAPNFSYELEEAVADGYLVPYETLQYHSAIMENGIKWNDLSTAQRERLDEVWTYERAIGGMSEDEDYHRDINKKEIFNYLYNTDTINKVLHELMDKGLRIHGGEDIGKTIIFAMNHKHAELIVEQFRKLYPEKGEKYCQLIDNYVQYAGALILDFSDADRYPQIAVSVDMLDTGIDVPSILNLVFFKRVKSKIKFMQMIGRGTRLCPNLFGNRDKEKFYIFDWCNNFEYFSIKSNGAEPKIAKSLTEKIFSLRLDIAFALQSATHQEKPEEKQLHDNLKTLLHSDVESLNHSRIDVRVNLNKIEPYRSKDAWVCLSAVDVATLKDIAPLLPRSDEGEAAKRFDVLMLHVQLSKVDTSVNAEKSRVYVSKIAKMLEDKATIPTVGDHLDTIREVQEPNFWEDSTINILERVRNELRDLVQLLDSGRDRQFIINIEDETSLDEEASQVSLRATYKQRVVEYLANNTGNPTLLKITNFEQLTTADIAELQRIFWEELGTREEFDDFTAGKRYSLNVAAFIRVIKGIDRKKALAKYAEFIAGETLNSEQEQYLKNILDYISVNGDIQLSDFMEYPLKHYQWRDVFGNQFVRLKDFVKEIHKVIEGEGVA